MKKALLVMLAAALIVGMASGGAADDKKKAKPKYTIKQVMKQAMKSGLLKKVAGGKATDKEKLKLLDLYISMLESKPKKGTTQSWMKLSGTLVYATARAAVGREGASDALKKASNCGACHKAHK